MITLNTDTVRSVYNGARYSCACGCSGRHSYPKRNANRGTEIRGYELGADEVSDTRVRNVIRKVEQIAAGQQDDDHDPEQDGHIDMVASDWVSAVKGNRMYVVYLEQADPEGLRQAFGHLLPAAR
jgi:hypothetical protein